MPEPALDTRHAPALFRLTGTDGKEVAAGSGDAVIDDDGLTVGSVTISFLDADTFQAEGYRIELGLWPGGTLELSQLGRRFDSFTAEARRTRNQARVAGMLAHGLSMPSRYTGISLGRDPMPVECQIYDTHVTIVPVEGDPYQIPLGTLSAIEVEEEPPSVLLSGPDTLTVIGHLGRRRDEFQRELEERRQRQARQLESITGRPIFGDGRGIERSRLDEFESLIERWSAPDRADCAQTLLRAATGQPRLGFVQLLDPDDGDRQRPGLPDHWAVFLLAPIGSLTALEILAGPAAATYLFERPIDEVNRDLQLLHFRRGALALSKTEAELTPANPYRLALRRLEPLKRLRAATRARIVHNDGWATLLAEAARF